MSEQSATAPAPDPDLPLVREAKQGNYDRFEELVGRHERYVYTLALRIVHDAQDAQEIVQETFLSVIEHLKDFNEQSRFRTWLVRIATNHALKALRRRRVRHEQPLAASGEEEDRPLPHPEFIAPWREQPASLAQQHETQELLTAAMAALEEKYRLVFLLRDVEGLPIEETAAALGITPANVKVRLLRARLMLRERLTRSLGDSSRQVRPSPHPAHQT